MRQGFSAHRDDIVSALPVLSGPSNAPPPRPQQNQGEWIPIGKPPQPPAAPGQDKKPGETVPAQPGAALPASTSAQSPAAPNEATTAAPEAAPEGEKTSGGPTSAPPAAAQPSAAAAAEAPQPQQPPQPPAPASKEAPAAKAEEAAGPPQPQPLPPAVAAPPAETPKEASSSITPAPAVLGQEGELGGPPAAAAAPAPPTQPSAAPVQPAAKKEAPAADAAAKAAETPPLPPAAPVSEKRLQPTGEHALHKAAVSEGGARRAAPVMVSPLVSLDPVDLGERDAGGRVVRWDDFYGTDRYESIIADFAERGEDAFPQCCVCLMRDTDLQHLPLAERKCIKTPRMTTHDSQKEEAPLIDGAAQPFNEGACASLCTDLGAQQSRFFPFDHHAPAGVCEKVDLCSHTVGRSALKNGIKCRSAEGPDCPMCHVEGWECVVASGEWLESVRHALDGAEEGDYVAVHRYVEPATLYALLD
ncbi:unnamed protein product [Vitrella brassicaformis CCMP3155]|uniref:Uncharacterized protein n=1 Tax=Vitrella brassicaformis (strain CCMP3155) TaxID=1169540 RepID=A0A0G4GNT8_VITBC|nr:unnamed protein product [Vitrella brassicaformis CCMP3155]|eukprot:CEM31944.1 unnamed protein product [Vitrella brassicaformis CCMP3155]